MEGGKLDQTADHVLLEKKQKYDEIINILITAGYFRAQIQTLSEFDKVVGGLCWCIVNSGEQVDVDILFSENATIGQRIALSEAIVIAMRQMNCPYPLQPHQIQGGVTGADFTAINPVIIWLVKKFVSRRGERESLLRNFSALQFSRNFSLSTDMPTNIVSSSLSNILARNKAVRKFQRKLNKKDSESIRVHSCLLEYGEMTTLVESNEKPKSNPTEATVGNFTDDENFQKYKFDGPNAAKGMPVPVGKKVSADGKMILQISSVEEETQIESRPASELSAFERKLAQAQREAEREEKMYAEQASREEEELMKQMRQVSESETTLAGSQVGAIVGIGSGNIGSAAAAYEAEAEAAQRELDMSLQSGKLGQAAAMARQKQHLLSQKEELVSQLAEIQVENESMSRKLLLIEEEKAKTVQYNQQLKNQLAKLTALEESANQNEELKLLKQLILSNETYKSQEAGFKASCKAQMAALTAQAAQLEITANDLQEEDKKLAEIEAMYNQVKNKYNKLRQVLADANLEVASTTRTIDDIPTRTELIQYERRFAELYQQVAWKLEETRKYYSFYNHLQTSLSFIQTEIKLLNSINDNFEIAMKNPQSKQEYLNQCKAIVKGVETNAAKQESILEKKIQAVDELKMIHQTLVDKQRTYFRAVKEFQEECTKNEILTSKLEQLTN